MNKVLEILKRKEFYTFIAYIAFAFIFYFIIKAVVSKIRTKNKRQTTIKHLIMQIIKVLIILIVILTCLSVLGIDVTSFIAGLGIAGVVVGLALQDFMKDVLSGIGIIFEDQFDVGDTIEINGFVGEVIGLSVKTTRLKNYEGKIKIIANRNISEVINYSKNNNFAIIDVPISYEDDLEKVEKVFESIKKIINKEVDNLKDEVQILGINNFADSAIIYRLMVEVKSGEQYTAQRKIRKIIKQEFDKNNLSIPYNKLEVINGNKEI